MPTILVTDTIAAEGLTRLRERFPVIERYDLSPSALIAAAREVEAIVTRSNTPVTADLLFAGSRLAVVGRAGIGIDNIDVAAATAAGVMVVNSPTGNADAAAEHTIGLIFALARHIPRAHIALGEGAWGKNRFVGTQVAGKTLGIIGLGKIGGRVARLASALGMRVIAHDPYIDAPTRIPLLSRYDLLRAADFVTVHVPLTAETVGLLGARELALVKPTTYLINCARGGVIDETALAAACRAGAVAGAAVDVFSDEPLPAPHPLRGLPNIILTPHIAGSTREAQDAIAREIADDITAALTGGIPRNLVNPEMLTREEVVA